MGFSGLAKMSPTDSRCPERFFVHNFKTWRALKYSCACQRRSTKYARLLQTSLPGPGQRAIHKINLPQIEIRSQNEEGLLDNVVETNKSNYDHGDSSEHVENELKKQLRDNADRIDFAISLRSVSYGLETIPKPCVVHKNPTCCLHTHTHLYFGW